MVALVLLWSGQHKCLRGRSDTRDGPDTSPETVSADTRVAPRPLGSTVNNPLLSKTRLMFLLTFLILPHCQIIQHPPFYERRL